MQTAQHKNVKQANRCDIRIFRKRLINLHHLKITRKCLRKLSHVHAMLSQFSSKKYRRLYNYMILIHEIHIRTADGNECV